MISMGDLPFMSRNWRLRRGRLGGLGGEGLGGEETGRGNCGRGEKQMNLKVVRHSDHFAQHNIL